MNDGTRNTTVTKVKIGVIGIGGMGLKHVQEIDVGVSQQCRRSATG
jgi:hypothetical protein